ncbi:hypothetical protein SAMN04487783_1864 [Agrococcus baldri]|uniref:Uncharacterized protein n=1 Tax=Agrococcus baldri TaxID=153730 RepID=A0AA94HN30_9MICO|nr:hypothetical protein [Agrococcus baldri]SFS14541.1 hypothetical protein SAMN04487783_1864 [Agrococcus baldri]
MNRDEDALHWEGDDELDRLSVVDAADEADGAAEPGASAPVVREARHRGPLGWLMLVLAVAATAGWVVILVANPVQQPSLVALAMYQLGELLAVLTPLLWWFVVDRVAPLPRRALWWLAGLVVTAPWPLVAGVLA